MPLVRRSGQFFGTLCALDPEASQLSDEQLAAFRLLADLIAYQLEEQERSAERDAALLSAQEAAALREQFIAVLGHDVRNPLAAIGMTAQRALRETPAAGPWKRVAASAARIERLVADTLDFARGRLGGGMPLEVKPSDYARIATNIVEELRVVHPDRVIRLALEGTCAIELDGDRFGQVISNLVANAVQYSPATSPIDVHLVANDAELVVRVRNEGPPIPPELMPQLFMPFVRGSGERRQGLGLGLYIASEIVRAHHGTIEARSSAAEATTFTVRVAARSERGRT